MPELVTRSPELLIDAVDRWAATTPDRIAIRYGDRTWTWSQWRARIARAAGGMRAAGIGPGDRVAFLDKNHPACLEIALAAASLGAAVTIANWRLAGPELGYVLADSAARLLFAGAEFAAAAAAASTGIERVVVVGGEHDEYERFLDTAEAAEPDPAVRPEADALVIYSSGTTGHPKGVVLSQRALVAHTVNAGTGFPFDAGDVNLVAMPLFHVGGICYALFGIRAGVPSIMTREPTPAALLGALAAGATHTFFVPPVIAALLDAGEQATAALGRLKYLGYGAAPMPLPLLRRALDTWPDLAFVQVYGQTEVSGVVTMLSPEDHRGDESLLLSAGRPVPGAEVRVVDPVDLTEIGVGGQGELWFRTDQRMTGYLNRPDATAATVTADGWVRTGDIGRVDDRGFVFVEDRLKDMIITGGENVYGPEVERVLLAHPAVSDAAVVGVPDDHWGESVHAVVVAGEPVEAAEVIAHCRSHLAGYKCPKTVEFVAELPRNASGKILKRTLREPHWSGRARAI
ncbi:Long-chain-fatty-acid--CoA ligase FadD13 [Nocardia farcinica]|uniref:AMP-binding protein n=1 Tax=Nocardia farcinica TaxID=37329 RepID=UPI000BFA44ED|nr:AMP-binding protein [Nocardia farcinica]PFX03738.1 Long-chain-fatty-acid--CoA ligase FadD13 [Nocardia farcinica]PFX09896.1 Long-chain-fatty-acid--CoA ligase FadD13 [Nocardia farcinica]